MSATADNIWEVPAYLPYLQPKLTSAAIKKAEAKIGYPLPVEYLDLLRTQNGGYIRLSLPESPHDTIAGIGPRFPSLGATDFDEIQEYVSFALRGLVPFDGDGHWHICLDYRNNSERPSIAFVDIELDRESPIAASFADYLSLLKVGCNDELVLEEVSDLESVKSELAAALNAEFGPPDSWAHGYPTSRAPLGSENNPEWLWISPNLVQRGFVRTNEPDYQELKDLLPGMAPRFPEVPESAFLLNATDKVRDRVIQACQRLKLHVRPLAEYLDR